MSEEIVKPTDEIVKESVETVRETEQTEEAVSTEAITPDAVAADETTDKVSATETTTETAEEPIVTETAQESTDVIVKSEAPGSDEKTMGMLAHLLGIFTTFIGPLVIWLTQKDQSKFAETEAREALNFQISLIIYYTVLTVITTVLSVITLGLFSIVGSLLYFALYIFSLVVMIMGTVQAKDGKSYQYPLCIRFIQ